jgi:hypothetical protein
MTFMPTTVIVETWTRVCQAPCNKLLDANQTYRLNGDGMVSSNSFVLEPGSARVKGRMGSTGERAGAAVLIGFGIAHLAVAGVLIGLSTIVTPGGPGEVSFKDVFLGSGIGVIGASLFAFVPAIMMWSHSASHAEVDATGSVSDLVPARPPPRTLSRDAAAKSLGRAIDRAREECRDENPTLGPGHARITFARSGEVTDVSVDPPYGGTPMGDCVANLLRRAAVPPFDGEAVSVGKTFQIGD